MIPYSIYARNQLLVENFLLRLMKRLNFDSNIVFCYISFSCRSVLQIKVASISLLNKLIKTQQKKKADYFTYIFPVQFQVSTSKYKQLSHFQKWNQYLIITEVGICHNHYHK